MLYYAIKVFLAAGLIVFIGEVVKRSNMSGALLASVPLTSLAVMIWLYIETGDELMISSFSANVFWLIIASLPLFLVLSLLIKFGWSFWLSMAAAILATVFCYGVMLSILKQFGVQV